MITEDELDDYAEKLIRQLNRIIDGEELKFRRKVIYQHGRKKDKDNYRNVRHRIRARNGERP